MSNPRMMRERTKNKSLERKCFFGVWEQKSGACISLIILEYIVFIPKNDSLAAGIQL